jgi:hypothetical protein
MKKFAVMGIAVAALMSIGSMGSVAQAQGVGIGVGPGGVGIHVGESHRDRGYHRGREYRRDRYERRRHMERRHRHHHGDRIYIR